MTVIGQFDGNQLTIDLSSLTSMDVNLIIQDLRGAIAILGDRLSSARRNTSCPSRSCILSLVLPLMCLVSKKNTGINIKSFDEQDSTRNIY